MGRMSFANFSWFGDGRRSPAPDSDAYLNTPPLSPSLPPPVLTKPAPPLYAQPAAADAVAPTTFTASGLLKVLPNGRTLFNGIDFSLNLVPEASPLGRPDVLVIRGNSGAGKTTFLRCLAQLDSFTEGTLLLGDRCGPTRPSCADLAGAVDSRERGTSHRGRVAAPRRSPKDMGYPEWRSRVLYVPQKSPALPGTPDEFVHSVGRYFVQKRRLMTTDYVRSGVSQREARRELQLLTQCGAGVQHERATSSWTMRSGYTSRRRRSSGRSASCRAASSSASVRSAAPLLPRAARARLTPALLFGAAFRMPHWPPVLALALWRKPNLMLLDEPTSALDPEATLAAEELLTTYPCVWITHSDEQERRIATKRVRHGASAELAARRCNANGWVSADESEPFTDCAGALGARPGSQPTAEPPGAVKMPRV